MMSDDINVSDNINTDVWWFLVSIATQFYPVLTYHAFGPCFMFTVELVIR